MAWADSVDPKVLDQWTAYYLHRSTSNSKKEETLDQARDRLTSRITR